MNSLVQFLIARIDDDEDELRKRARLEAHAATGTDNAVPIGSPLSDLTSVERLRAECTAKRQLIGSMQRLLVLRDLPSEKPVRDIAEQVLRDLAAPYSDHRQFRREWASPHKH